MVVILSYLEFSYETRNLARDASTNYVTFAKVPIFSAIILIINIIVFKFMYVNGTKHEQF